MISELRKRESYWKTLSCGLSDGDGDEGALMSLLLLVWCPDEEAEGQEEEAKEAPLSSWQEVKQSAWSCLLLSLFRPQRLSHCSSWSPLREETKTREVDVFPPFWCWTTSRFLPHQPLPPPP